MKYKDIINCIHSAEYDYPGEVFMVLQCGDQCFEGLLAGADDRVINVGVFNADLGVIEWKITADNNGNLRAGRLDLA